MVRNVHATLDDEEYERAKKVKDDLDLTWREFIVEATGTLGEEGA